MAGYDPLTGEMRYPRPGESLMGGPPETTRRKKKRKPGLAGEMSEEEWEETIRTIGRGWTSPEARDPDLVSPEKMEVLEKGMDEIRKSIEAWERLKKWRKNHPRPPIHTPEPPVDEPPTRGVDHLMDEIDNAAKEHKWPDEEKKNAKNAIEAFMDDDSDLFYEDLALAWTGDMPGGHGIAYETNASGEFEDDEIGVYYPETKETEYFTSNEWADIRRSDGAR
jgi:hypothetical protein